MEVSPNISSNLPLFDNSDIDIDQNIENLTCNALNGVSETPKAIAEKKKQNNMEPEHESEIVEKNKTKNKNKKAAKRQRPNECQEDEDSVAEMKKQLKEKDEEIKKLRNQIHQLNEKINGLQNTIINSQEKVIETIDKRFDELKNENQTTDIQINEKKSMTAIPKKKIEDTNNNIANTKNLPITPTTKTNEDFPSLPKKVGKDNSVPSTSKKRKLD
ncbi:uncharacterized protein LOC126888534 [Diabrotica virgifera virgifera]|uniref:Uncharacterized protein n=1 Tax=Diabrotica virgifera virgifera TaxID=50390 RepID=A0ABM5KRM5_DIAVI|nr:uncharacterized protein LOC126888534 [Diabrotica virgifera virgifera]